jgi:hypothetical protein
VEWWLPQAGEGRMKAGLGTGGAWALLRLGGVRSCSVVKLLHSRVTTDTELCYLAQKARRKEFDFTRKK